MNRETWSPRILSLVRFVCGLLFFEHGLQKILHFPPLPAPAVAAMAKAVTHSPPQMVAAGYIELVCGALITLGLFGSQAAFIASGEMAFAYFMAHAPRSLYPVNNQGDAAILYCFIFLLIAFTGSGPHSLDALLKKKA